MQLAVLSNIPISSGLLESAEAGTDLSWPFVLPGGEICGVQISTPQTFHSHTCRAPPLHYL